MKKNIKLIATLMTIIGVICTGFIAYRLYEKFFGEDDIDLDCFDDEFEEDDDEEEAVEEVPVAAAEEEEEEEKPLPKVRRGYIPLKFHTNVNA